MTIRNWIIQKLSDDYNVELEGDHGLRIKRHRHPTAFVYCVEKSGNERFRIEHFEAARHEIPAVEFIVLVKREAENEVYEHAEELGICVSGFGDLQIALANDDDISRYWSREQAYLRGRLTGNRHVSSVRRIGESAYEISRHGGLGSFNIITIAHYELTSDTVYELIERNDDLEVKAIVSTNPNCEGFAPEALEAGAQTGTRILPLKYFLRSLNGPWN
ncbi:hypothetical protein GA0074695_1005 [Micromonospora viridifaciens]|uniref:Uncharacterized protein n=1 Tax=Micromonospora viridifaciens TaxID=1881 RepID=A0A1C4V0N6_MICVI|nr:hypothetical protein [Micromonospora viridifaciens]SCE77446.1 hypothetical protein GA0074695_1005 [Micromonospora viridifaciens]